MSDYIHWDALAKVIAVGLAVGAGLPAMFALGVRALEGKGSHRKSGKRPPIRILAAVLCFGVVVAAIAWAIYLMGK